jgi:DNA primase catalytic core
MSNRDDVDAVRSRTDILQVVAPYVALKRSGRIWKGLCPFHNEKTPSFQVNPDLGHWHCFGQCSEGGDVFKFLQKIDNLTFPEALERLAIKAGITLIREPGRSREVVPMGEKDRLYAALNAAVNYYSATLQKSAPALEYLAGRGILPETIEQYQIGFAGGDWDTLPRYLDQCGIPNDDAVRAGILAVPERGGHYDKLRGRIVFPIVDVQNRTVAFGGRLMQSDAERPKYLNSAETPLFSKSKTLYGLSRARKPITDSDEAIIVEGYLDVITCHQSGFLNVVATLGTSLTEEHAVIIKRLAARVLLAFDSDAAGVKAAHRAHTIFEAQDIEVRILDMPKGEDPDSLINSGQADQFRSSIVNALPVNEYRLKQILSALDLNMTERERTTLFQRDILPILRSTKSVIERERYIRMCAPVHPFYSTGSALAEEHIRQEVDGQRNWQPRSYSGGQSRAAGRTGATTEYSRENKFGDYKKPVGPRQSPIRVVSGLDRAEETIIQALLAPSQEYAVLLSKFNPATCVRPAIEKLARVLISTPGQEGIQAALQDSELANEPDIAQILMGEPEKLPELTAKSLEDSLKALKRRSEDSLLEKLRSLSREGDLQANELYTRIMRERKGAPADQKLGT